MFYYISICDLLFYDNWVDTNPHDCFGWKENKHVQNQHRTRFVGTEICLESVIPCLSILASLGSLLRSVDNCRVILYLTGLNYYGLLKQFCSPCIDVYVFAI